MVRLRSDLGWDKMAAILHATFSNYYLYENYCTLVQILQKFVPVGRISYGSALLQIMTWCGTGDTNHMNQRWPSLLTQIFVTQTQEDKLTKYIPYSSSQGSLGKSLVCKCRKWPLYIESALYIIEANPLIHHAVTRISRFSTWIKTHQNCHGILLNVTLQRLMDDKSTLV